MFPKGVVENLWGEMFSHIFFGEFLRLKENHAFCCVVFPSKPLNKTLLQCVFCIGPLGRGMPPF